MLRELSGEDDNVRLNPKNGWPTLDPKDLLGAMLIISTHMRDHKIPLIGTRSLEEVTKRLMDRQLDAAEERLSKEKVQLIEDYLAIQGPPRAAMARIIDLTDKADINIAKAFKRFEKRLDLFKERGIELKNTEFSAEFGRSFEYYTGFVFQIEAPNSDEIGPVAGGGRYDSLLKETWRLWKKCAPLDARSTPSAC